jgi:hypothetical protein
MKLEQNTFRKRVLSLHSYHISFRFEHSGFQVQNKNSANSWSMFRLHLSLSLSLSLTPAYTGVHS